MDTSDHRPTIRLTIVALLSLVAAGAASTRAEVPLPAPSLRAEEIANDITRVLDGEWPGFHAPYGRQCFVRCAPRISREGEDPVPITWPPQMPGTYSVMRIPNPELDRVDWTYCEIRIRGTESGPPALDRYGVLVWRVGKAPLQSSFIGWGRGDFADSTGNLSGAVEKVLVRILPKY